MPSNLEKETTHRYSKNSFKLHRLPIPRPGEVLGLVGTNGIGKSTALKILAGKQKPNLGQFTVRMKMSVYIQIERAHIIILNLSVICIFGMLSQYLQF